MPPPSVIPLMQSGQHGSFSTTSGAMSKPSLSAAPPPHSQQNAYSNTYSPASAYGYGVGPSQSSSSYASYGQLPETPVQRADREAAQRAQDRHRELIQSGVVPVPKHTEGNIGRAVSFETGPFAGRTMRAEITEIQKADLGRKCADPPTSASSNNNGGGNGEKSVRKDRRPLDPPPVVSLQYYEVNEDGTERLVPNECVITPSILESCFVLTNF